MVSGVLLAELDTSAVCKRCGEVCAGGWWSYKTKNGFGETIWGYGAFCSEECCAAQSVYAAFLWEASLGD